MTSWACLLGSGLKLVSHWKAQSLILFKSFFSSFTEVVISCVTKNRDVSSASSFEDRSPDKLFMYIKNNNGPKMEPWGTPVVTFHHSDVWPFRRTLCFLSLKKLDKRPKRLPDNLKRRPLCHTLSILYLKPLEMPKKTLFTSNSSWNELQILCVI